MKGNADRVAIIDAIEHASREELTALSGIEKSIRQMGQGNENTVAKVSSRLRDRERQSDTSSAPKVNPYRRSLTNTKQRKRAPVINTKGERRTRSINANRKRQFELESDADNKPISLTVKVETEEPRSGPLRDSNGRYVSQQKSDQLRQKNHAKNDAELESGFARKLAGLFGESSQRSGASDNTVGDAVGLSAGGPLWMATKGMWDIGKAAQKNVVSMSEWMKEKGDKKGSGKTSVESSGKDNVIQYPAAPAANKAAPVLGSAKTFANATESKSAKAVEEQTKTLAANDDRIVEGLENVQDEIRKLSRARGGGFGFNLFPRRPRISGGAPGRGTKAPAKKKPGLLKRLFSTGKGKIIGGLAAGAAAIGGGAFFSKGLRAPTPDAIPVDKSAKSVAKATEKTTEKTAAKTAEKMTEKTVGKTAAAAAAKTGEVAAEKGAIAATEKAGEKTLAKGATAAGAKVAAKTSLKMVPIVGTALGVGWDAVDGWSDDEGQRKAFKLNGDEEISGRQKATYSAASILDMGGLISGGVGLLGDGLSAIGLDGIGNKMQFDTSDIASGLNGAIESAKSGIGALVDGSKALFESGVKEDKEVIKAVQDGTGKTVTAINNLGAKLQGGTFGEDGVGAYGTQVSHFDSPAENHIGADLNIGGNNAKNRSFRNNNFGNLNYVGQEGATLEAKNSKGEARFARFNTPEEGMRALANQVSLYSTGRSKAAGYQKLETVSQIISKWAPTNENDTNAYIQAVSQKLGVRPNDKIDTSDQNVMTALIRAIATHEGGNPQVNDEYIKSAIGNFDATTGKWVGGQFSDESLVKVNAERAKQGHAAVAKDSLYSSGKKVKAQSGASASIVPNAVPLTSPTVEPASKEAFAKAEKVAEKNTEDSNAAKPEEAESNSAASVDAALIAQNSELMVGASLAGSPEELQAMVEKAKSADAGWLNKISGGRLGHRRATNELTTPEALKAANGNSSAMPALPPEVAEMTKQTEGYLAKFGVNIGFRRPDSALSTSTGQEIPAGLKAAMGSPSEIGSRTSKGTLEDVSLFEPDLAGSAEGKPAVLTGREAGEEQGIFGSIVDSSLSGLKAVGASVLPALGDRVSNLAGGLQGTNIVNDLVTGAAGNNTNVARAVSPLTRRAGQYLDGGIKSASDSAKDALYSANDAIFNPGSIKQQEPVLSMPRQMPVVTDLAASGVRQPTTGDSGNHDLDMLKALERVQKTLQEILGTNKAASKGEPNTVSRTAQPAPRERASTTINDPSLDALLKD